MGITGKILTPFRIIILGFAGIILVGTLLLMLPIASSNGVSTQFGEALFTATSAVCVTGLIVCDTATHWSVFGRSIILLLIQTGGLGIITVAASISHLSGKHFSLKQRNTMQTAISAQKVGGIVDLTKFVIASTFAVELVGALLLMPFFVKEYGAKESEWLCFIRFPPFATPGLTFMGSSTGRFSSLTSFSGNIGINTVIMLLIVIGGLGFRTWDDIITKKLKFKHYRLQSKIVIVTSGLLIAIPALLFFFNDLRMLRLTSVSYLLCFSRLQRAPRDLTRLI
jgi:trk system potassium uptake protein TrkH